MSRIDYLEIDGHRIDERSMTRVTEYRCDSCGEFVKEPSIIQMSLYPPRGIVAQFPQYHLHDECVKRHFPFMLADLEKQGITL